MHFNPFGNPLNLSIPVPDIQRTFRHTAARYTETLKVIMTYFVFHYLV